MWINRTAETNGGENVQLFIKQKPRGISFFLPLLFTDGCEATHAERRFLMVTHMY
jgi:hypothetical protein